ncbi:MAG: FAD-dependent oxidoreductase [Oscillospiraceae bacterium]
MAENSFDIIIIGAGYAGMTAAVYAKRAGKSVLLLESEIFGGQIATAPLVENYPSVPSISGEALANTLFEQVGALGVRSELEKVTEIIDNGSEKVVVTDYGSYSCRALIVATGMKHRHLDLPRESELFGRGVSYCAVCDGVFFKNKEVAVFGGGDAALQNALFLSEICKKVTVIHRRNEFRGEQWLVSALEKRENVSFALENVVNALLGDEILSGVELKNTKTGEITTLNLSGLFVAIGQVPENSFLKGLIETDGQGFIIGDESCRTNANGIFVAGDCRTKAVRQLTTAAADGSVAALAACEFVDRAR